jgi:hypothetical protein
MGSGCSFQVWKCDHREKTDQQSSAAQLDRPRFVASRLYLQYAGLSIASKPHKNRINRIPHVDRIPDAAVQPTVGEAQWRAEELIGAW